MLYVRTAVTIRSIRIDMLGMVMLMVTLIMFVTIKYTYKLNVSVVDKHDFFVCIISIVSIARDDEFNADLK